MRDQVDAVAAPCRQPGAHLPGFSSPDTRQTGRESGSKSGEVETARGSACPGGDERDGGGRLAGGFPGGHAAGQVPGEEGLAADRDPPVPRSARATAVRVGSDTRRSIGSRHAAAAAGGRRRRRSRGAGLSLTSAGMPRPSTSVVRNSSSGSSTQRASGSTMSGGLAWTGQPQRRGLPRSNVASSEHWSHLPQSLGEYPGGDREMAA